MTSHCPSPPLPLRWGVRGGGQWLQMKAHKLTPFMNYHAMWSTYLKNSLSFNFFNFSLCNFFACNMENIQHRFFNYYLTTSSKTFASVLDDLKRLELRKMPPFQYKLKHLILHLKQFKTQKDYGSETYYRDVFFFSLFRVKAYQLEIIWICGLTPNVTKRVKLCRRETSIIVTGLHVHSHEKSLVLP